MNANSPQAAAQTSEIHLTQNCRLCHVLVIAPEYSPSLALVASYTLGELEKQDSLLLRVRTAREASAEDLSWSDIVFAVRPATAAMATLVSEAKRIQRIVMCHWDDDLLSIPQESSSYAYFSRPGVRNLTLRTLLLADVLLTSSNTLAAYLQSILNHHERTVIPIIVLPVPALDSLSNIKTNEDHLYNSNTKPMTIGYAGSADQTDLLQELIIPSLEKLWSAGHNIRLQIIGPTLRVNPRWCQLVTKIPATKTYAEWLSLRNNLRWDLAVAPLATGHFYSCKYYNKYLEFSAAGIACLFSNVPPFNTIVHHEINGFLTENTPPAWAQAIAELANSPIRNNVAKTALADVAANYSLALAADETKRLLGQWFEFRANPVEPSSYITLHKHICWLHTNILRRYL